MALDVQSDTGAGFLGRIVRHARASQGLTQNTVAERAGVSSQAVLDLEAGRGTLASLMPVMDALDIRLNGLPRGRSLLARMAIARERRGMTLDGLAERAGISKGSVLRLGQGSGRVATLEAVLRVLAPTVSARKPERAHWAGGRRDCRFTPPDLFAKLEAIFGDFHLDPCADPESPISTPMAFTEADDGLSHPWLARSAYVNPPYSDTMKFVSKAYQEWSSSRCELVVLLLPTRTHGNSFYDVISAFADTFFLRHRISFLSPDGSSGPAPFGNMVVVFGATEEMIERMKSEFACVHLPRGRGDRRTS